MLAINGMMDHIHIFIEMKPDCNLSALVREIKKSSNKFIKEKGFTRLAFSCQEGFGAFSYHQNMIDIVVKYILNQKEHHRKKTFREGYLKFLEEYDVSFDERYLFSFHDIGSMET
jgi:REP element-mobilizing transposase RayT